MSSTDTIAGSAGVAGASAIHTQITPAARARRARARRLAAELIAAATLEALGHPIPSRTCAALDEIAEHVSADLAAWRRSIGA